MDANQQKKLKNYVNKQNASDEKGITIAFRGAIRFLRDLGLRVIADTIANFLEDYLGLGLIKHAWNIFKAWIDGGSNGSLS